MIVDWVRRQYAPRPRVRGVMVMGPVHPTNADPPSAAIGAPRCALGDECPCWREGYRDGARS